MPTLSQTTTVGIFISIVRLQTLVTGSTNTPGRSANQATDSSASGRVFNATGGIRSKRPTFLHILVKPICIGIVVCIDRWCPTPLGRAGREQECGDDNGAVNDFIHDKTPYSELKNQPMPYLTPSCTDLEIPSQIDSKQGLHVLSADFFICLFNKANSHEKNLPTQQTQTRKNSWLSRQNGNCRWPQSNQCAQSKRPRFLDSLIVRGRIQLPGPLSAQDARRL